MHIVAICCTYNRDKCLQRILRSFLEQTYEGKKTLLVFNSGKETSLAGFENTENTNIILVNQTKGLLSNADYQSVGEKYNDALSYIEQFAPDCEVVTSYDADDIFLPNHIEEGYKGYKKALEANKKAYKPKYSYFRNTLGVFKAENVFEPSIFVSYAHMKEFGYAEQSVTYHDKWLHPLVEKDEILVDKYGESTFIYDWSGEIPVYKMSGQKESKQNFLLSQKSEKDTGNGTTVPISKEKYLTYCKLIKKIQPIVN